MSIECEAMEPRRLLAASADDYDDHTGHDHAPDEVCALPPSWEFASASAFEIEAAPPFTLDQTFLLHSRPSASKVVYLDFDGHTTSGTSWNIAYENSQPFVTPAYSFEGSTSSFSNNELERIQRIWQRVVEDFSPFDVDVTTQLPSTIEDLRKSNTNDTRYGVRVVIGGDGAWYKPDVGGVAYIGSFTWSSDTPCFVFEDNLSSGAEKTVAEAISHEVGHTLGLGHDGRISPSEGYYYGHGSGATGWAPIMGVGYNRELVQWSKGEYLSANNTENDLSIITTQNGFGYRPDDHGNTAATASALSVGASGVISTTADVDVFTFSFPNGGAINMNISPFYIGPNLDILAELYNSSNALVASSNPSTALDASLNLTVGAGAYALHISGVGKGDPLGTGYTDYASLGQYSISGAFDASPATPINPSPANGATNVDRSGLVLDWSDAANATSYDVYLNDMTTPKANVTASQWTVTPQILGGTHQWKVVARNGTAAASSAVWTFSVPGVLPPTTPVVVSPSSGSIVNSRPVTLDWQDSTNATAYDLYVGGVLTASNLNVSTWTGFATGPAVQAFTWRVDAKNIDYTIQGPEWSFTIDTAAPLTSFTGGTPSTGASFHDFTVTYTDTPSGVNVSTLDSNDITITGPNGYSAGATFISVNNPTNGSPRIATYRMSAPGGFWNDADHGAYTITLQPNQVYDASGTARATSTTVGTLNVSNLGFAWLSAGILNVAFDGSAMPVMLKTSGANVSVNKDGSSPDFTGVSAISILGSNADDRLQINAPLAPPVNVVDSGGNDLLEILGGTYTLAADIGTTSRNLAIYVAAGANAVFNVTQTLRSLSVDGNVMLTAGGDETIVVTDLAVTGRLNLTNNTLVWNNPTPAALDTITNLVRTGRAGGAWNGNGIVTDRANAIAPQRLATLGVSQSAASVVVQYTYAGDANLDEIITADDFFAIDSGFSAHAMHYAFGDFDYSGRVDVDDYFLIDSHYNKAQSPLA